MKTKKYITLFFYYENHFVLKANQKRSLLLQITEKSNFFFSFIFILLDQILSIVETD
jgi:hypothetical protein